MVTDLSIKLYQAISDQNEKREYTKWHASGIAGCPRAQYYARIGVPSLDTPSASLLLRWGSGHHMETAIREPVLAVYPDAVSNMRFESEKLDLTGEFDNYSRKEKALIEIKSVHDYAFIERDDETTLKEQVGTRIGARGKEYKVYEPMLEPYTHHILQNTAYKLLLDEQEDMPVEKIIFVYMSLSGRIVTYEVPIEDKYVENVTKRLETLNACWKAQTPPDCICSEKHPLWGGVMQYCDYRVENGECCDLKLLDLVKGKK